tara:strand:+ start:46 stop:873 length:828 start_codon:yes stop_codon:yes gene_type:complete
MPKKDKDLHFPLCLLSSISDLSDRATFSETLNLISFWAYGNAGQKVLMKKREEAGECFCFDNAPESQTGDLDYGCPEHLELAWGAAALGMNIRSYVDSIPKLRRARSLADEWEADHGEHLFCRIRRDLFIEALEDCGTLPPRDFLVLCGLYAVIENARFKQVSHDRIYYAASGCRSKVVFQKIGRQPTLTRKQVHSALDKLHMRGLFVAVTYRKRFKYFSHSLTQKTLRTKVQDSFKKKAKEASANRRQSIISTDYSSAKRKKKPTVSAEHKGAT